MIRKDTICSWCGVDAAGKSIVQVAKYDHDKSPALLALKSFHVHCFTHIAGKKHIFYDQLPDSDDPDGRVGRVCVCDKDVGRIGVSIAEISSQGKQVWAQFFHTDCFLKRGGENFFE